MKTINQVIETLIEIGNRYPKTQSSWERLFSPHTHQAIAQNLIDLQNITEQDKVDNVIAVIYSIYQKIERPGKLLTEIDACLRDGVDFESYAAKCTEIQKAIDESDNKAMNAESCDLQITFNIKNYRDAIETINPNTLQITRDMSAESSYRQSYLFSNDRPSGSVNNVTFHEFDML